MVGKQQPRPSCVPATIQQRWRGLGVALPSGSCGAHAEVYVNDVLAHPYTYKTAAREALSLGALSVPAQQQGRDGGAVVGAAVGGVRAWRMTLPYQ